MKYNKNKKGIITAMTMKQVAEKEGKHYQTIVKQKHKYIPINIKISDKREVVRYLTSDVSDKVKLAIENPQGRKQDLEKAMSIYSMYLKRKQYNITDKTYQDWILEELEKISYNEKANKRQEVMDSIIKGKESIK